MISTIFLNKLYELENKKQLKSEVLRKCQQEVSLLADCPLEEIEVYNNQYYSNGRAHYVLKHEERRFMCFTGKDSIEVKEHEYLRNKTLEQLIIEKQKKKRDSTGDLE